MELKLKFNLPDFIFIFTLLQSVFVLSDSSISGGATPVSVSGIRGSPDPLLHSLTSVFDLETVTSGRSRGVSE